MKKQIVMTSINAPTEAVRLYAAMTEWETTVIGDKKTPSPWSHENITYFSPDDQLKLSYKSIPLIPWNLPARANIGFLKSMEQHPEFITQSDDDNIPNEFWGVPQFEDTFTTLTYKGFINIYKFFTDKFVWPRGLPLNLILENPTIEKVQTKQKVGAWQHLANKDTDVDAIYRLTNNAYIYFDQKEPHVLSEGTLCPFNCQSTTFHKDTFVLMYLPSYITPRASDIVRGLIAQPIMWHYGYSLGFTAPTVTQERNPHNYLKDFKDEILIYLHSEDIVKIAHDALKPGATMSENFITVYQALVDAKLVPAEEMPVVKAWVEDVTAIQNQK